MGVLQDLVLATEGRFLDAGEGGNAIRSCTDYDS